MSTPRFMKTPGVPGYTVIGAEDFMDDRARGGDLAELLTIILENITKTLHDSKKYKDVGLQQEQYIDADSFTLQHRIKVVLTPKNKPSKAMLQPVCFMTFSKDFKYMCLDQEGVQVPNTREPKFFELANPDSFDLDKIVDYIHELFEVINV